MTHGLAGKTVRRPLPHRLLLAGGTPLALARQDARAGRPVLPRSARGEPALRRSRAAGSPSRRRPRPVFGFWRQAERKTRSEGPAHPWRATEALPERAPRRSEGIKHSVDESIHIAHLLRLIDPKTTAQAVTTVILQGYVNARANEREAGGPSRTSQSRRRSARSPASGTAGRARWEW